MIINLINRYKHLNWTFLDQGMVSGVNFLTGFLLARFLGIEEFGIFTLLWLIVLFANTFQFAMISAPMMSIGPKTSEHQKSAFYNASLIQQLIFSVVTFIFLYVCVHVAQLLQPDWNIQHLAFPLAAAGFFFQNQDFIRRYFFCKQKHKNAFINDSISYLGQIIILLLLFFTDGLNVVDVYWVISATSAVAFFFGLTKFNVHRISFSYFCEHITRNVKFSKWLTASGILQWTSGNFVLLTAGAMLGSSSVGALKAAQNIIGVTHILFQAMENFVPINASHHFVKKGTDGLFHYLKKVMLSGGLIVAIICIFVSLFSEELMLVVYGSQYQQFSFVLNWYAAIYLLIFICLPLRTGLVTLEMTRFIFFSYLAKSLFSVAFSSLLINYWGIEGALLCMLVGQLIMLLSLLIYIRKHINTIKKEL